MEFKITHETTLYELQEYCKSLDGCDDCSLRYYSKCGCSFDVLSPDKWNISKPKTYKEDFLEKFPNVNIEKIIQYSCIDLFYGLNTFCDKKCEECWNRVIKTED